MIFRSLVAPWNIKLYTYIPLHDESEYGETDRDEKSPENQVCTRTHSNELTKHWRMRVNTLAIFSVVQTIYLIWAWRTIPMGSTRLPQCMCVSRPSWRKLLTRCRSHHGRSYDPQKRHLGSRCKPRDECTLENGRSRHHRMGANVVSARTGLA